MVGANFPDVLMCRGLYQVKPPLPFTPGVELCGEVVALGPGDTDFATGDRVIGSSVLPAGGFGEFALMDASRTFSAPDVLDDAEAASFYIGYQTGWFGLHRRAHLQPGETLLVHAAAGGVGSGAVQLGMHIVLHTDADLTRKKLAQFVPVLETHISQHKEKS
jgi:NADPH2:quinone reductase